MDTDTFTPTAGGSLRDAPASAARVARFTVPRAVHPDEIWEPRGGELAGRSWPGHGAEHPGRHRAHTYMGEEPVVGNLVRDVHQARAALRPGAGEEVRHGE